MNKESKILGGGKAKGNRPFCSEGMSPGVVAILFQNNKKEALIQCIATLLKAMSSLQPTSMIFLNQNHNVLSHGIKKTL